MSSDSWRIERFDKLESTNTMARALAKQGYPSRTFVIARTQTKGRGRQGRLWYSMAGNLLCTALWRPDEAWPPISTFPLAIALAAKATIDRVARREIATIKWPNDILVGGRKICGILVEAGAQCDGRKWLIAGVGINVASYPPDESGTRATSLVAEDVIGPGPDFVGDCLLEEFDRILAEWLQGGFDAIRGRYLAALRGLGDIIRVRAPIDGAPDLQGKFVDIAEDGRLMLQTEASLQFISAGDVFGIDE